MNDFESHRAEVLLSGKDISVYLGEGSRRTLVLSNLSFEVRDVIRPGMVQGQIVGLLAPSGVGKTTMLRAIAGLQDLSSGSILVGDKQIPTHQGLVGVVGQKYPLFLNRTVMGNLCLAAKLGGTKRKEAAQRAMALLERFCLGQVAELYPSQLSGGQRQRVAIIQQMLCSEHLLLMDEPFSGLDYLAKKEACRLIQETARADEQNTVIIVSHDIETVGMVADTVWLLGRDYINGAPKPGARIQKEYDLIDMNLAWHEEVEHTPQFAAFVREVKKRFEAGL